MTILEGTRATCMVALIPPMPRLFPLLEWQALIPKLPLRTLTPTELEILGAVLREVKEARSPLVELKGETCISWRTLCLPPKHLQVHLLLIPNAME